MEMLMWHVVLEFETDIAGEFMGNHVCIGAAPGFPQIGDFIWCGSEKGDDAEYQVVGVSIGRRQIRIPVEYTNLAADTQAVGDVDWYYIDAYVLVDFPERHASNDEVEELDDDERYLRAQQQFWLGGNPLRGKKQWILEERLPPGMYASVETD